MVGNGNGRLTSDIEDELAKVASSEEDLLGLDHADKNGRNGWGRSGGGEIKIR